MSDKICRDDLEISSLLHDASGSDQTKPSNEFKFWGNNFDGLKFLYDHLNAMEDVNKVKTISRKKLTRNISSYLIRCGVLTQGLFESGENY